MHSDAEHCLEYIFDLYSNTRHYAQTNASQNHFYLKFYNIVCVHYWQNVMMMINADDDVCHRPKILSVWEALVSCLIFSYWSILGDAWSTSIYQTLFRSWDNGKILDWRIIFKPVREAVNLKMLIVDVLFNPFEILSVDEMCDSLELLFATEKWNPLTFLLCCID